MCVYHYVVQLARIFWTLSHAICLYHPSLPAGFLVYTVCPYRTA